MDLVMKEISMETIRLFAKGLNEFEFCLINN